MSQTLIALVAAVVMFLSSNIISYTVGRSNGKEAGIEQVQKEFDAYKKAQEKKLFEIVIENGKKQEALNQTLSDVQLERDNAIQAITARHTALISSLRNRADRDSAATRAAEANTTIKVTVAPRTASTGKELSREDAEFLAGEAASADILRQALEMCIRSYDVVRGAYNEDGTYREPAK
jgi:hypothetical protein